MIRFPVYNTWVLYFLFLRLGRVTPPTKGQRRREITMATTVVLERLCEVTVGDDLGKPRSELFSNRFFRK